MKYFIYIAILASVSGVSYSAFADAQPAEVPVIQMTMPGVTTTPVTVPAVHPAGELVPSSVTMPTAVAPFERPTSMDLPPAPVPFTAQSHTEAVAASTHNQGSTGENSDECECCEFRFPSFCSFEFPSFKGCWPDIKCHETYLRAEVSRAWAHKFTGYGASIAWGWFYDLEEAIGKEHKVNKGHALEIALGYLEEQAYANQSFRGQITGSMLGSNVLLNNPTDGILYQKRHDHIFMIPLMLNYRYHGSMEGWSDHNCLDRFTWYLGCGVGLNYLHWKDESPNIMYDSFGSLNYDGTIEQTKGRLTVAAQFDGGIGYQLFDYANIYTGIRAFLTDGKRFGEDTITPLRMGQGHLLWDFGFEWFW